MARYKVCNNEQLHLSQRIARARGPRVYKCRNRGASKDREDMLTERPQ